MRAFSIIDAYWPVAALDCDTMTDQFSVNAVLSVQGNDLIFIQGHSSPGIYSRAFLEGRLTENQLNHTFLD